VYFADGAGGVDISLQDLPSLTELRLPRNYNSNITMSGLTSLSSFSANSNNISYLELPKDSPIKHVNLSDNPLTSEMIEYLESLQLETLKLN
jgi:hypothetical protein